MLFFWFFLLKEILGGPHAAEQHYDAEFFKKFRNQNIVLSARTYARVLIFILLECDFVLVLLFSLKCIFLPLWNLIGSQWGFKRWKGVFV